MSLDILVTCEQGEEQQGQIQYFSPHARSQITKLFCCLSTDGGRQKNLTIQIARDIGMTAGTWTSSHLGLLSQSPFLRSNPLIKL